MFYEAEYCCLVCVVRSGAVKVNAPVTCINTFYIEFMLLLRGTKLAIERGHGSWGWEGGYIYCNSGIYTSLNKVHCVLQTYLNQVFTLHLHWIDRPREGV